MAFTLVKTFDGVGLPYPESWSPDGRHFALRFGDGIAIMNVDDPDRPLSVRVNGIVGQVAWSPTGDALACLTKTRTQAARGTRDVLLMPLRGTSRVIARECRVLHPFWLDDGSLCAQRMDNGAFECLAAASMTHIRPVASGRGRPMLLSSAQTMIGLVPAAVVLPSSRAPVGAFPVVGMSAYSVVECLPAKLMFIKDTSFNRALTLAAQDDDAGWRSVLLDSLGSVVRVLHYDTDPQALILESFSSDGSYLLGFRPKFYEESRKPADYALWAEATDGSWRSVVEGAPDSHDVTVSEFSGWVLLGDREHHKVHLGRLHVAGRSEVRNEAGAER